MTRRRPIVNLAASARARLLDLARRRGVEFQLVLSEFAIERLLYRLGVSPFAERFVLKGATLFKLWTEEARRATWDLDLLGRGASGVRDVVDVMMELCAVPAEDGIVFDATTAAGDEIRKADEYVGVRVRLEARLAEARIPMQIDVGFGDVVIPPAQYEVFPTLLDHPAPRILTYPREAVVAEKLDAMLSHGVTNSRMKDFYDLERLARSTAFEGRILVRAVRATFERRGTPLPSAEPIALAPGFLAAPERETQWRAFLRRGRLAASPDIEKLVQSLRRFLLPVLDAVAGKGTPLMHWEPGGPWERAGEDART